MFVSDNFYLDNIYCTDKSICMLSMDGDVINNYGLNYSEEVVVIKNNTTSYYYSKGKENEEDLTIQLYYVDNNYIPLEWDDEKIKDIMDWVVSDNFIPFVSEDNLEITYYVKAMKVSKMFTYDRRGYLEVVFKPFSSFGYKEFVRTITSTATPKIESIYNYSNVEAEYRPILEITNSGTTSTIISIRNKTTDDEAFTITGLNTGQKVYIDCLLGSVQDDIGNNLISKCNRKFLKMSNGATNIEFSGSASIVFKAQFPIRM